MSKIQGVIGKLMRELNSKRSDHNYIESRVSDEKAAISFSIFMKVIKSVQF